MTSTAKMPNSCWGRYLNVALVQLNQHYTASGLRPKFIGTHARGVLRVIRLGHHFDGKSDRCAAVRVYQRAVARALEMNSAPTVAHDDPVLMSWGGSA